MLHLLFRLGHETFALPAMDIEAVLALPEKIEAFTRPFISAYWAWSGSVEALQGQVHGAVGSVIDTGLSSSDACLTALLFHITIALAIAWYGSSKPQWN